MELFTVKEVARWLSISGSTVRRLVKNGQIPGVVIGSQYRVFSEQLLHMYPWLKNIKEKNRCRRKK
ncbi:helix-turn-helix domain-containing protein [Candidatus Riflebacteria bacterium]